MPFKYGVQSDNKNKKLVSVSSGDAVLDELLGGFGFQKDLVYLLYGDKKKCTNILSTTAVLAQKSVANGGFGEETRVAFIDANNQFNPYDVSKFAASQNVSPKEVLENILITRAFTWDQMVELMESGLSKLEQVKVILISGITTLIQTYEKQTFVVLEKSINKIKEVFNKINPVIILTAPMNEYSLFKPIEGKNHYHLGHVFIRIREDERYTEYILVQHPYLSENRLLKWKPRIPKKNSDDSFKNSTLNSWL